MEEKMKKILLCTLLASSMILIASMAMAGKSSVEMGKNLFNDASLGGSTNAKSCNSCHADGKGMEKAGGKKNLVKMVNRCIVGPLKGDKIDGRSVEMRSLKMYIQSLGK